MTKKPPPAHGLFHAYGKAALGAVPMAGDEAKPPRERIDHGFHPTPPEPTRSLLRAEAARLARLPGIWENAAGDGAMAREIERAGHQCFKSDLIDRGCGAEIASFYDYSKSPRPGYGIISNPPFEECSAKHGHGRWISHTRAVGVGYAAYLLPYEWPAAVTNGLGALLAEYPFARMYLCRWKIDFTGNGSPPQRNAWFIWDDEHVGPPEFRILDRGDPCQAALL